MSTEVSKQTIYDADFRQSIIELRQPVWLKGIRKMAMKQFREFGFPSPRNEDWKYTNIAPIAAQDFSLRTGEVSPDIIDSLKYAESAANTLVFIDGVLRSSTVSDEFSVTEFNDAYHQGDTAKVIEQKLGQAVQFTKNGFTALSLAMLRDGALINIPKDSKVIAPIHLLFIATDGVTSFPRVLINAEQGSNATVIESHVSAGEGKSFSNAVVEVFVADNAQIKHYRVQKVNPDSFQIGTSFAVIGRDSVYDTTAINLGGAISRHDVGVKFTAPGGECFVDGLYMLNGSQHADTHSIIDHTVPNCNSHQNYKGVLSDKSHAVFNGIVFVREDARGTDAKQSNKNLLLSNDARIDTKPQLEIFNDDVKCAHGATVGQLADEEIFYLLSRGIHPDLAKNLLTYGFAEEVISKIDIESIKAELDEAVLNRLNATLEA